jgi:agmatine/peptidylarginine deiminase
VANIVWIARGLASDDDTDGHLDRFLKPVPTGDVLLQLAEDDHVDHDALTDAGERLVAAGISVLLLDVVAYADDDVPFPYLSGYACNDAVLVPQSGDAVLDERAVEVYRLAYPEREPIGIHTVELALGGGGISALALPVSGDPD